MVREENTGSRKQTENVASAGIMPRAASLTQLVKGNNMSVNLELIDWSERYPNETQAQIGQRQSTICGCGKAKEIGEASCGCGIEAFDPWKSE